MYDLNLKLSRGSSKKVENTELNMKISNRSSKKRRKSFRLSENSKRERSNRASYKSNKSSG
jgi:hypothetical protein